MSTIVLIHQNERRKVSNVQLVNKSSLFRTKVALLAGPYDVKSIVAPTVFHHFLDSLEDKPLEITTENISDL
jgi:hypothetical protein